MAKKPAGQKTCGGTYWHATPNNSQSVDNDVRKERNFRSTAKILNAEVNLRKKPEAAKKT